MINSGSLLSNRTLYFLLPVIVGLIPVVVSYAKGRSSLLPEELSLALVLSGVFSLVVAALCFWKIGEPAKASVYASVILIQCSVYWFFALILDAAAQGFGMHIDYGISLVIWALLCWDLNVRLSRLSFQRYDLLALAMSAATVLYFACVAITVIPQELRAKRESDVLVANALAENKDVHINASPSARPDIYYIIVDAFANAEVLARYYKYDQSKFIQFLKDKGFEVQLGSCANHDRTRLSVSSSLNMKYMTQIPQEINNRTPDASVMYGLMRSSRVVDLMRKAGYKIVNVCSDYGPTQYVPTADVNFGDGPANEFVVYQCTQGLLAAQEQQLHLCRAWLEQRRLSFFNNVERIKNIPGPKFVLAHILITHPPQIFREDGTRRDLGFQWLSEPYDRDLYLSQLKFAEKKIESALDQLLSDKNYHPIIVLQSDHGPSAFEADPAKFVHERMRILNAYLFPDAEAKKQLYQTISPVNTFRLIFRQYFGANLPNLPDESYMAPFFEDFKMTRVTEKLQKQP